MPVETIPFDGSEYIDDEESQQSYLADVFGTGDPAAIAHAIGVVAKARGMTAIARDAGVQRSHLYRALSARGKPEIATVMKVLASLGLRLSVVPAPAPPPTTPAAIAAE